VVPTIRADLDVSTALSNSLVQHFKKKKKKKKKKKIEESIIKALEEIEKESLAEAPTPKF
jgi:hypothetical protein